MSPLANAQTPPLPAKSICCAHVMVHGAAPSRAKCAHHCCGPSGGTGNGQPAVRSAAERQLRSACECCRELELESEADVGGELKVLRALAVSHGAAALPNSCACCRTCCSASCKRQMSMLRYAAPRRLLLRVCGQCIWRSIWLHACWRATAARLPSSWSPRTWWCGRSGAT